MGYMYICDRDGQLYTGITTDLSHRMKQHKGKLLYSDEFEDKHKAARREKQIKRCLSQCLHLGKNREQIVSS